MSLDKLLRHIKPQRVLDVGANVGEFTKELLSHVPDCQVVMIEPNPHCEKYLKTIGQRYDMVALSDHTGVAELYIENANLVGTGASLYRENTIWYNDDKCHTHTVPLKMLDGCNYFDDGIIDLVKLDVQGSELDVIKGGRNTIKNTTFVLAEVSLTQYNQGAPLMDSVVDEMVSMGFCIADVIEYHQFNNIVFQLDLLFKNLK